MNYRIVDGADKMKIEDIARLLKMAYWANKRSPETVEASVRNSSCYGVYAEGRDRLAGFARVISDYATTWYLCDVIIDEECRGQGLGKALISHIASLPEYRGLRGILLTRDAHGLYSKYGFEVIEGGRAMSKKPG